MILTEQNRNIATNGNMTDENTTPKGRSRNSSSNGGAGGEMVEELKSKINTLTQSLVNSEEVRRPSEATSRENENFENPAGATTYEVIATSG